MRAQAQRECEAFIAAQISAHASFAVETTLRSDAAISQAVQAKHAGFRTEMTYVATNDAEVNVERVALRALDGGHGASADRVREIYVRSLANLSSALATFDTVLLFDNSDHGKPPTFVCEFRSGRMIPTATALPVWLRNALAD